MFPFKKPPTRAQVAQQTVASAVSGATHSLSQHAHELLEGAHDFLEEALENAHDKLEIIGEKVESVVENLPLEKAKSATGAASAVGVATVAGAAKSAGEAAAKAGALGAGAATAAATAGKSVAGKVGENLANARQTNDAQVPDVKRARKQAQKEIDDMNKKAAEYARALQKQLARDHETFVAEQERMEREYEQLQNQLEVARAQANEKRENSAQRERKSERKSERKFDEKNGIVRVPVAPDDEVVAVDDAGDYRYDGEEKSGGGNAWLIVGGVLLAGAGALYYLFSSTGGRRKRAQIQDRVGQVADGVREKVTQNSDATGEPGGVEEVTAAASEFSDFSNEKIADDEVITGTIEAKLPPTSTTLGATTFPEKAVDTLSEVSDKVADGIAGAGAFLADKLEAAGAGAKNAAHSAAEKLDDAKDKASAKLDEVKNSTSKGAATSGVPDAVVVEIISDEPAHGESPEAILAEVEETVRNIENSARERK